MGECRDAIGAGTDVVVESADIVFVGSDSGDVADIIVLSKKTCAKKFSNLLRATGYNTFAIPSAAGFSSVTGSFSLPL